MKGPDLPIAAVALDQLGPAPRTRVVARGVTRVDPGIELCSRCRRAVTAHDLDTCRGCATSIVTKRRGAPTERPRVWSANRSGTRSPEVGR